MKSIKKPAKPKTQKTSNPKKDSKTDPGKEVVQKAKLVPTKRPRLFLDIETSPNIGLFWQSGYKQKIDYSNIIEERAVICICYKWEGEKVVHSLNWDEKHNDKKMLLEFSKVLNKATEIVGHNIDKFDMPWVRTRCLYHGIELLPEYTSIDTLQIARRRFRLNSNRLNYIANFLGLGQKIKTEFDLWKSILLKSDQKALDKMIRYCKQDVILLEKVFHKLFNHVNSKYHYGVHYGQDRGSCKNCGSDDLSIVKHRITSAGTKKIQYQCKTCGKYNTKTDTKANANG